MALVSDGLDFVVVHKLVGLAWAGMNPEFRIAVADRHRQGSENDRLRDSSWLHLGWVLNMNRKGCMDPP